MTRNLFMASIYHFLIIIFYLTTHPTPSSMEDVNLLPADCAVISCCCQCLILQILILILLKLPYKLLRKMKCYAKKFRSRKQGTKTMQVELTTNEEDGFKNPGNSFKIDIQDHVCLGEEALRFGCYMDEIDALLEELSSRGEFAFGSFHSCFKEEEIHCGKVLILSTHLIAGKYECDRLMQVEMQLSTNENKL